MVELKEKYGVELFTCAEPNSKYSDQISKEACLSVSAVNNMLGTSIPETATGKQRQLCACYGGKTDLLKYDNKCASSCVYCYAHHNNDKNLNYYNEDGTLKDNPFTRTEIKPTTSVKTDSTGKPIEIYRGYALMEDREANDYIINKIFSNNPELSEIVDSYKNIKKEIEAWIK